MTPRRKGRAKKTISEESDLRNMFAEYREENAKDLEREAMGHW